MATTTTPPTRNRTKIGTYFLSLTVENVRCFGPAQTLDLSDGHGRHAPWTVILGENGLGKTTLLTSLVWVASRRLPVPELLEWVYRDIDQSLLNRMGMVRKASGAEAKAQAMLIHTNRSQSTFKIETKFDPLSQQSGWNTDYTEQLRNLVTCYYGASRRMPERAGLGGNDQRGLSGFLDSESALRDPEDWLLTADYNALLGGPDAERFEVFAKRVREALIRILPEVAEIRIQAADEPGGSPRVEAKTPDGWVPLRRLGFGYQSQIAWLVDFASRMFERYPDSPDPLAEPAVVLVDEIDLHMHPRWQRQIVAYLTERCPNTQFIVTAHSPLVVQAAADANIVLLRREGDHVVIENDPEVLSNWRVDQILTSELFGLDSARPPQIEAQLKERRALLAKPKLTSRDRKRLDRLQAQIGELPAGESAEDRRAMELIRRAASKLQSGA
jgi:AAA domain, putative AbiEii toxin, Type IV TA system/AAA domain